MGRQVDILQTVRVLSHADVYVYVCMRRGARASDAPALKSCCSVSYDRPSVCRCSSRNGGVPWEASKSSQGSGGGEPRLSESFSMFIHPALLLLLLQHRLHRPHSASKCGGNSLTPALEPLISLLPFPIPSLHLSVFFLPTSLYLPFHFTSSQPPLPSRYLPFLSLFKFGV